MLLGLNDLKAFYKLAKFFKERGVTEKDVKTIISKLRKLELSKTTFGRRKG
jgi:hypothetical protein